MILPPIAFVIFPATQRKKTSRVPRELRRFVHTTFIRSKPGSPDIGTHSKSNVSVVILIVNKKTFIKRNKLFINGV